MVKFIALFEVITKERQKNCDIVLHINQNCKRFYVFLLSALIQVSYILPLYFDRSRPYERRFSRCFGRGPESQEGACESLKGLISILSHRCFILIFSFFGGIFNYFQFIQKNNYVKFTQTFELCLSLLCIKHMLSRHSTAQEIKHS